MKIKQIETSNLIPYGKNTKKHDAKQVLNVAQSIKEYGFIQPIVVDKDNVVVIGHCRLLAAKKLGMKTVPCVCVDELTDEQVKALRIVDNKSNESEWDFDFLADELSGIDLSGFDFNFNLPTKISDEMLNELFVDSEETKEKESKRIQCPHCGEWFERKL